MATVLGLYNQALRIIGERQLASTSEQREPRRVLDDVYADVVDYALAQGMWDFAMRRAVIAPTVNPGAYGFTHEYTKPVDLLHLFIISNVATFDPPLIGGFAEENTTWYANGDSANSYSIYVRYTSNHATLGGGLLTAWPRAFENYVAACLAGQIANRLTASFDLAQYTNGLEQMRLDNCLRLYSANGPLGRAPFNSEARTPPRIDGGQLPERFLPFGSAGGRFSDPRGGDDGGSRGRR